MKNLFISATLALSMFAPVMGHAMILDEATVQSILGTRMPSSDLRVGKVDVIYYNSVYFYDNILDITNRVLSRSMRADIVRVHTNSQNGQIATASAQRNQETLQTHCVSRLTGDGVQGAAKQCQMSKM